MFQESLTTDCRAAKAKPGRNKRWLKGAPRGTHVRLLRPRPTNERQTNLFALRPGNHEEEEAGGECAA